MGSVAPLKRDYGTQMLLTLQEHFLARADAGRESDLPYASRLLAESIDNPASREATLMALAQYLSQALTGIFPDL